MLPFLSQVLLAIRVDAGLSMRAMAKRCDGVNHASSIMRIEGAQTWPRDTDALIAAYADVAGITPAHVWARATKLYLAAERHPDARSGGDVF